MDFLALSCYVSIRSQFHVVISLGFIREKRCSVRLYLQLFVGELMSYSRYLCLFAYSGVQRILCSGFFFGGGFRLVYPMLPVSLDCPYFIAPSAFFKVYLIYTSIKVKSHSIFF